MMETKTDISNMVEVPPPRPPAVRSPMESATELLKAGLTTEQLKDMMQLQLQWEANEARKAYIEAMAAFKRNPPEIVKTKLVDYPGKSGGRTRYMHSTLGDVCDAVIEALATHGFSHRWASRHVKDEGIYVQCILTHRLGHSEVYEMGPGRPDDSGGKNPIQAIASTTTYFQRYSLLGITGLTTNDIRDDDGQQAGDEFRIEEWIRAAEKAEDLLALSDVKDRGFAIFKKRNDPEGFKLFKDAVKARRAVLENTAIEHEPGSEG